MKYRRQLINSALFRGKFKVLQFMNKLQSWQLHGCIMSTFIYTGHICLFFLSNLILNIINVFICVWGKQHIYKLNGFLYSSKYVIEPFIKGRWESKLFLLKYICSWQLKKSPPETERKIKSKQIAVAGFLSVLIHLLMTHFGLDYNNYNLK